MDIKAAAERIVQAAKEANVRFPSIWDESKIRQTCGAAAMSYKNGDTIDEAAALANLIERYGVDKSASAPTPASTPAPAAPAASPTAKPATNTIVIDSDDDEADSKPAKKKAAVSKASKPAAAPKPKRKSKAKKGSDDEDEDDDEDDESDFIDDDDDDEDGGSSKKKRKAAPKKKAAAPKSDATSSPAKKSKTASAGAGASPAKAEAKSAGGDKEAKEKDKGVKKTDVVEVEANRVLAEAILEMAKYGFKSGDARKGGVFSKAAKAIREADFAITNKKDAMKLPGVGKGIADYIVEKLTTGQIVKLEEMRAGIA